MSRRDLIDPEAREPLDQLLAVLPGGFNAIEDIVARREAASAMLAAVEVPPNPNVTHEDRAVPGPEGAPDISVRIYRPVNAAGSRPGVYFIHGGGMILGTVAGENAVAEQVCEQVGAVVVSVEYRLAPENPHPAPTEDCYAGLTWMARHAADLPDDRPRQRDPVQPRDHRPRRLGPPGQHPGLGLVPRRGPAGPVRRPGAGRGPVRAAAGLYRRRHPGPVPG